MDKEFETYLNRLTSHIIALLGIKPAGFQSISKRAGGAYPADVFHALQILIDNHQVQQSGGIYRLSNDQFHTNDNKERLDITKRLFRIEHQATCDLSDPHPADYDWRYTWATQTKLVKKCLLFMNQRKHIALLGTPTLLPHLVQLGIDVTLFDRSKSIISDLKSRGYDNNVVFHDLFSPVTGFSHEFEIVIADPPWYPAFYEAFILRSSELLSTNGILLLSVPGWLTRPSVLKDRNDILHFSAKAGLGIVELVPNLLIYETPKFEYLALKAKGIKPENWRVGDLFVFRQLTVAQPGLKISHPHDEPIWDEYCIGKFKIKIRIKAEPEFTQFHYQSLTSDYNSLDTVSRRSSVRSKIDVWTSNNRAFCVTGIEYLKKALSEYISGRSIEDIITNITIERTLSIDEYQALRKLMTELIEDSELRI